MKYKEDMENNQTAVEWLMMQLPVFIRVDLYEKELYQQAKAMEKEQEFETKLYWFGRGILASRENRIKELKPKRN
jgi:hypothetical protein